MSSFKDALSLSELKAAFADESSCVAFLERLRWNGDITSPFDETSKIYKCSYQRYRCRNTGKYFNVRTNTIFHGTKVALPKWFEAIWYISEKPDIAFKDLADKLDVSAKTAWLIQKRISRWISVENTHNDTLSLSQWLLQLQS